MVTWGREAPNDIAQLSVLELHGIWLAKHNRVLPAQLHHQQRPSGEQAAQSAHALLRAELGQSSAQRRVEACIHRPTDCMTLWWARPIERYLQQLWGTVELVSPPLQCGCVAADPVLLSPKRKVSVLQLKVWENRTHAPMQCPARKMEFPLDDERRSVICGNMIHDDQQARALPNIRTHEQRSYRRHVCERKRLAQRLCRL